MGRWKHFGDGVPTVISKTIDIPVTVIKRNLYLVHRWLGIIMCLFFLMWFVTGVVMMYVPFPSLTSQERLSSLPNLSANNVLVAPTTLISKAGTENIDSLRLTTFLGRPAYLLKTKNNEFFGVFADDGEATPNINSEIALQIAEYFYLNRKNDTSSALNNALISVDKMIDVDQWTVSASLNPYRPFYKVEINNKEDSHLYVSAKSGEVVRDTTKSERIWNWFGANLHWIYPVQLRKHPSVWHWVVVVLSLLGLVAVFTGSIIGLIRLRLRRRYRGKDVTPYKGISKYHHILGLACCIFLFTYIFSGLLSMNPFGVFNSDASCELGEGLYAEFASLDYSQFSSKNIQHLIENNAKLKEIDFYPVAGKVFPLGVSLGGKSLLSVSGTHQLFEHIDGAVKGVISRCNPSASIERVSILDSYDSYYYSHHGADKPLPVYRFILNDSEKTRVYINARTGEWLTAKNARQRVQRWLYNGLHSLDFLFLIERRPLWDIVVISLCLLGALMSLTGVIIGSRRLRTYTKNTFSKRRHITSHLVENMRGSYVEKKSIG